jgi:hypothetical protein
MIYPTDKFIASTPVILYRNDHFLTSNEIFHYQQLLKNNRWKLGNSELFDKINYVSQDLYNQYQWDGHWQNTGWLDTSPADWEVLYHKISQHLPKHYLHWADVKITSTSQGGTPIHRDLDPWSKGGDPVKFKKSITILCNLNTAWAAEWGGGLTLHNVKIKEDGPVVETDQIIPIFPGQLLIVENCYHSIELITQPAKSRVSFILHVLEYNHNDSN